MKLSVFCLLAVLCSAVTGAKSKNRRTQKLQEVLKEVRLLKEGLQRNGQSRVSSLNIEHDCCCLEALKCFQASVLQLSVSNKHIQAKLKKSLGSPLTVQGLSFCDPKNATNTVCRSCDSYPRGTQESLDQLESLIQRAITMHLEQRGSQSQQRGGST